MRDLRHMQKAPKTTLTTYQNQKPIKQQSNQPKKVYGFNQPSSTPTKTRKSRTPVKGTPVKGTPLKGAPSGTAEKTARYSKTPTTQRRR